MTNSNFRNITAQKTAEINQLKESKELLMMDVATKQASLTAYQEKAELFSTKMAEDSAKLNKATEQLDQATKVYKSLIALKQFFSQADEISGTTNSQTNKLIGQLEAVVQSTINAAQAIQMVNDLVVAQKAANPLISSNLVSKINQAATTASITINQVTLALNATFSALSATQQSFNAAKILEEEIAIVNKKLETPTYGEQITKGILKAIKYRYEEARNTEMNAQNVNRQAQGQLLEANSALEAAQTKLGTIEAALAAAKAAVGAT